MSDLIQPLDEKRDRQGWAIYLDGHLTTISLFRASGPLGVLSWGLRPEKTVGWLWQESGGGGVGIMLYSVIRNKLYVGLIKEVRPNMDSHPVWNMPRGFLKPGDSPLVGAVTELQEEVGFPKAEERLERLAEKVNPNSAFWVTLQGGFCYFSFPVSPKELDLDVTPPYPFRTGLFNPTSRLGEKILDCAFFPWTTAAQSACNFTSAGVARLLAMKPELFKFL